MKNKRSLKLFPGLCLIVTLLSSAVIPARSAGDEPFVPPTLVRTETSALVNYANDLKRYAADCQTLRDSSRLSGEQLKKCLSTLRGLHTRFDGFLKMQGDFVDKITKAGKWTKQLDDEFERFAQKRGASAELVNEVAQKGGFRSFFQSANRELARSKGELETEIGHLEELSKQSASADAVAAGPAAGTFVTRRFFKLVKDATDSACTAVCCTLACRISS